MVHALSTDEVTAAKNLALVEGMPFILGDDGSYDHDLNRFFRACPTLGVRSPNSLRAYGLDILTWARFLVERRDNKSLWTADRHDVAAFYAARRLSLPPGHISAASWNRSVAALDKLYRWAVEEGVVARSPFTYRQSWRRTNSGAVMTVAANTAAERGARTRDVRFLSLDRYLLFREIGLRGRLPDGNEDPAWQGRNSERNALFAELLVTTGLRLQEAASLLWIELPKLEPASVLRSRSFRLASAIAKGSKGRLIRLPERVLKRLHEYAELERTNVLMRRSRPRSWLSKHPFRVVSHDRGRLLLEEDAVRASIDVLTPRERNQLVWAETSEPLSFWLAEGAQPMPLAAWEAVFRRASARCRRFGIDLDVTPHMLRHTFAVHMLSLLVREQIGWVLDERRSHIGAAYRRLIGDPLLKLQRLLGHSRIESTYVYLDCLEESQEMVDAAVDAWELRINTEGPSR
ncbi:tyrosine-type recombinase/integrase [Rhizobium rhizogenes]|uniref:tyrosine-type recombinase/integrase n=1 Tax=Rhizobium rhizogenes TaxID=359 RepID=UPI0024BEE552|nr:tyrosine-type recombinase/integrase [Rhizobium rhizogenes]MDJ1637438.1 tyrosine-type recombinase/integrase [Rhizobium rhizogenes]